MLPLLFALTLQDLKLEDLRKEGDAVKVAQEWVGTQTRLEKAEALRLSDEKGLAKFWKGVADEKLETPKVDFKERMVVGYVATVSCCDGIASQSIEVRDTKAALRIIIKIETMALGAPHAPGDKPFHPAYLVDLPKSKKAVEIYVYGGKDGLRKVATLDTLK